MIKKLLPFPVYHGTSSYYLDEFRSNNHMSSWPHKNAAMTLLNRTWTALKAFGVEPEVWVQNTMKQTSEKSNWQHGDLFVTPSKQSAVRYAGSNGACGGELLTMCKAALDKLEELDHRAAIELLNDAPSISRFLNGNGTPVLVEFTGVSENNLSTEVGSENPSNELQKLTNYDAQMREIYGQQTNFRLNMDSKVITRIFDLDIADANSPVSRFSMVEIID